MNHSLKNAPLKATETYNVLTLPSYMTLTQSYEPQRDLLTSMLYKRGSTAVAQRSYTYDALGRPLTRSTTRNRQTINDSFGYNNRSELTTATVNNGSYAYDYDNIGNRKTAQENAEEITGYQANALNQYAMLSVDDIADFIPSYDAAGNQTRVKTSTGIWAISYDAENRPTDFTMIDASGSTSIHCEYDYMGRRATKKVTVNGSVTLHQRFLYRGYLQIACCDLTRSSHPCLWLITWDSLQPVATRPLAIQKDGTWYTYGWDLTKNICEVYGQHGYIRANYSYSPYGEATISGDVTQPIQWSSEYFDSEIYLLYYNFRNYNPVSGVWLSRDRIENVNLYRAFKNRPTGIIDDKGASDYNCYAHACGLKESKNPGDNLPMYESRRDSRDENYNPSVFCQQIKEGVIQDGGQYPISGNSCSCGYRLIYFVVQTEDDRAFPEEENQYNGLYREPYGDVYDYHVARQELDGTWTHKQGESGAIESITGSPENHNWLIEAFDNNERKWIFLSYSYSCGYMCAKIRD